MRPSHPSPTRRPRDTVLLRIPASASNLGSGFDTLGLALRLYQFVRLTRLASTRIRIAFHPPESEAARAREIAESAARIFFQRTGGKRIGFGIEQWGRVPVARGLGASAVLRLGIVAGLNELTGAGLGRADLITLVTELEGHPDNASPAVLGGFTVSGLIDGQVRCLSFPVSPRLKCVTLIPDFGIDTARARRRLPSSYRREDAAHALNRAAVITAALSCGQYELLRGVFDDRMHQPYREPLIPELPRVIRAGEQAGAIGGFLSGAGSAIICLTLGKARAVARAMQRALPSSGAAILSADNDGFTLVSPSAR